MFKRHQTCHRSRRQCTVSRRWSAWINQYDSMAGIHAVSLQHQSEWHTDAATCARWKTMHWVQHICYSSWTLNQEWKVVVILLHDLMNWFAYRGSVHVSRRWKVRSNDYIILLIGLSTGASAAVVPSRVTDYKYWFVLTYDSALLGVWEWINSLVREYMVVHGGKHVHTRARSIR